jgi:hypothetical protein
MANQSSRGGKKQNQSRQPGGTKHQGVRPGSTGIEKERGNQGPRHRIVGKSRSKG